MRITPKGDFRDFLNPKSSSGYVMSRQSVYVSSGPSSLRGRTRIENRAVTGVIPKSKHNKGWSEERRTSSKFLAITQ